MKFGILLRNALGRYVFRFHKNRMGDEVIVTSFNIYLNYCPYFLQSIVYISDSIEHTNLILVTNTQHHDIHLMIKMKVTFTDDED